MNSLFQLDIPKRNVLCHHGEERLLPGMEYYSLITDDENAKIIRRDYCLACWQAVAINQDISNSHGYWQSKIEPKCEIKIVQSKTLRALALLNQEDRNEGELFVLSLFLARARQLILRKEIVQAGIKYYLFERSHQDEFLTIKKVELTSDEIRLLQQVLSEKLQA